MFVYVVFAIFLLPVWPEMAVGGLFSPVMRLLWSTESSFARPEVTLWGPDTATDDTECEGVFCFDSVSITFVHVGAHAYTDQAVRGLLLVTLRPMLRDSCPVCNVGVLWPNGWMDQDTTWYGGGPRSRRHCVRWGPRSPTESGTTALHFSVFSANFALARSPISATAELLFVEATSLILLKINSPLNFKAPPSHEIWLTCTRMNITGGGASVT